MKETLRERAAMRWLRVKRRVLCNVGLHDLTAYRDAGDGIHVIPIDPRGRPGPEDSRKCRYCDSRWEGAYDGMAPFWNKTRGPLWRRPAPMGPPRVKEPSDA